MMMSMKIRLKMTLMMMMMMLLSIRPTLFLNWMMIHMLSWIKKNIQKQGDTYVELDEECNYIFYFLMNYSF